VTGFEMILTRRMSHYMITYYLPSSLFVVVSWTSFLIPSDDIQGRMALLVTLFLVLVRTISICVKRCKNSWKKVFFWERERISTFQNWFKDAKKKFLRSHMKEKRCRENLEWTKDLENEKKTLNLESFRFGRYNCYIDSEIDCRWLMILAFTG